MGRPALELTQKVRDRIIAATRKGLSRRVAARVAGISPRTLHEWIAAGRKGDERFAQFAQDLHEADAHGEESLVDLMQEHAIADWRAAHALLKVRNQRRYGDQQKLTHEVKMTEEQARAAWKDITGREYGEPE